MTLTIKIIPLIAMTFLTVKNNKKCKFTTKNATKRPEFIFTTKNATEAQPTYFAQFAETI